MNNLPDEIVLQIAACESRALVSRDSVLTSTVLSASEVIAFSVTSRHFQFLTKDRHSWRQRCYDESKLAAQKRRETLNTSRSAREAEFIQAVNDLVRPSLSVHGSTEATNGHDSSVASAKSTRSRMVSWDPRYPTEKIDFYQEYVHRHAPIRLSWFEGVDGRERDSQRPVEAIGAGLLYDANGRASKLYAPLEDGSIHVWEARFPAEGTPNQAATGRQVASSPGKTLYSANFSISVDGAGADTISIDQHRRRGYFACANNLIEVDLETLQGVSRHSLAWPISALSESKASVPLVIGTMVDLQLFDPRIPSITSDPNNANLLDALPSVQENTTNAQQLLNSPSSGPRTAQLTQPGPLSIQYSPQLQKAHSIWVAGRFTHLLNYDLRYFPRLSGTIHSGARLASLTSLPHLWTTHSGNDTLPNKGSTIIAAGAYKGKGSLEMYSFSDDHGTPSLHTDIANTTGKIAFSMTGSGTHGICVKNRQTASSTKLLSVTNHGVKIAYSDGNAMVKWTERDGFTPVREFSVTPAGPDSAGGWFDQGHESIMDQGLWSRSHESSSGDVVQKLIPTLHTASMDSSDQAQRLHEDNLIVWTGDGRLGMLGFGQHSGWDKELWEERAELAGEEYARMEAERAQGIRMRQALQWQADEARFMQGMGLPFMSNR